MRKTMKRIAVPLLAAAALSIVPVMGHSAEDTTNCVTAATAQPGIPAGSTQQSLAPLDTTGVVWGKQTGAAAGELGAKGSHGWIKASGDAATGKGRIEGRQSESTLSGYLIIDGANSHVCLSAGGYKVKQ